MSGSDKAQRPDQMPAMEPSRFALATVHAIEAGESGARPGEAPAARAQRARFALAQLFAGDAAGERNAWLRFNALMTLHARGALGAWQRAGENGAVQLHPAVLDAASTQRLSRNGRFAPAKFVAIVEAIGRAHYADFEAWPLPPG